LSPYESPIFRTAEVPFGRCSHKYFSLYSSVSENPATNPLPSQKHTQGTMGVRHITDSRKLSWSFH
jgi:hypothetical protein